MKRVLATAVLVGSAVVGIAGCRGASAPALGFEHAYTPAGHSVVEFENFLITGVAATPSRLFVCSPRWFEPHLASVLEVMSDGSTRPFPDWAWNTWDGTPETADLSFVCAQSVWADGAGSLWVLDPGAPAFEGPVEGAPKLVRVDLSTDEVQTVYRMGARIAPPGSYLNDVRVDERRSLAYITDSGLGAIVVLDLLDGRARRVLDGHPSTLADPEVTLNIGGADLLDSEGRTPRIHADGIALDPAREWVYWQALTGDTLYRVPTAALEQAVRAPEASSFDLEAQVQTVGKTVVTDGMAMDSNGVLYFTALEKDAIVARLPATVSAVDALDVFDFMPDRGGQPTLVKIGQDEMLSWPDSIAIVGDSLLVSTSQIHRTAMFSIDGSMPDTPYRVVSYPRYKAPPLRDGERGR